MPRKKDTTVVRTIGINTGKNALHMVGLERKSLGTGLLQLANVQPCLIGIKAGMATHYLARELVALGHEVKQVPPSYAKPFRQVTRTLPRRLRGCGSRSAPFDTLRTD